MNYQPVDYIVEYVLCSTVFFIIIMVRYFGVRRFPNQKNKLYALILWATLVDLVFDVLSALIIDHVSIVPIPITYFVNTVFYILQILLLLLMTGFTLAMAQYLNRKTIRRYFPLLLPGLIMLLILLINPFTRWVFYVSSDMRYIRGPAFLWMYISGMFYMAATLCLAIRNKKQLTVLEYQSVLRFLVVVFVSMIVQLLYPRLLISGVAIAVAVILMYFTIQNPDSMLDTATGAFTYEAMLTFLSDRAQANDRIQLIAMKIRNMSHLNELLGVGNGSLLLKQITHFLIACAEDTWVFRMRGSSFVAITRSDEDYRTMLQSIQTRIGKPWIVSGTEVMLQATVSYVSTTELLTNPISPEETVNYLESIFLQNNRSAEPIRVIYVGVDLLDQIQRRRAVEAALQSALQTGDGLDIYLQPLWNVRSACYDSAEVLLRFHDPKLGDIAPDEFVPIAEYSGLVTAMDELVIRKTCAFIQENDLPRCLALRRLEINLSAIEFMHRRLLRIIDEALLQYQVDPKLLCFEITETAATNSFEILRDCMQEICQKGCCFALDDFGTGYANISQVIQLPFSIVKLDRSMLYGPRTVLADMSNMFARMERATVIEGVETAEQAAFVNAIGPDYIQGYFYATPMCLPEFVIWKVSQERKRLCR